MRRMRTKFGELRDFLLWGVESSQAQKMSQMHTDVRSAGARSKDKRTWTEGDPHREVSMKGPSIELGMGIGPEKWWTHFYCGGSGLHEHTKKETHQSHTEIERAGTHTN